MPKILHVSQPVEAGVAKAVADLALAQRDAGWVVSVASPVGGQLEGWLRAAGIRQIPWRASRNPSATMAREWRELRQVLAAERPDVLHLHSSKAGLIGRLVARGAVPTVFQPHGWSFSAVTGAMERATTVSERLTARWTDLMVCVSEDERELGHARGLDAIGGQARRSLPQPAGRTSAPRWIVVPNGVDTERFRPATVEETAAARERLGMPAGPAVVCVGRIARQKGQDVLLAGWPMVRRAMPEAMLYLVGDGPDRARLQRLGLPGVRFVGTSDDVRSWLWAADVVALPSRWEGLAYTLLEAMACGRSVVAADATGMRQALLAAADEPAPALVGGCAGRPSTSRAPAGAVVPVEDFRALATELLRRLGEPDLRASEGLAGRCRAVEHFSVHRSLDQICGATSALL